MSTHILKEIDNSDPLVEELNTLLTFFERRFDTGALINFLCSKLLDKLIDPDGSEVNSLTVHNGDEMFQISRTIASSKQKYQDAQLLSEIVAIKDDMTPDELRMLLIAGKHSLALFSELVFIEGLDPVNDISNSCYSDRMARLFMFFKEHEQKIKIKK
jgi:hypothetical protein